jgi:small subunit ribosomal protein S4
MSRYTGPSCRLCRREGCKLFLKGDRCYTSKCAIVKRKNSLTPGQHGSSKRKLSEYGVQLREKQKVKRYYGVKEKQFRNYFKLARKKRGITGDTLLQLLERRLDNVIYRIGYAPSLASARQLVKHGHFLINGKKVDIPSYIIKVGDDVNVKENSRSIQMIKDMPDRVASIPKWLEANAESLTCKIIALPTREDIGMEFKDNLIVELYSK